MQISLTETTEQAADNQINTLLQICRRSMHTARMIAERLSNSHGIQPNQSRLTRWKLQTIPQHSVNFFHLAKHCCFVALRKISMWRPFVSLRMSSSHLEDEKKGTVEPYKLLNSYTLGKLNLKYQHLSCLNLMISNFMKGKDTNLSDKMDLGLHISAVAFIEYVWKGMDNGPFLIVCSATSLEKWENQLKRLQSVVTLQ